MWRDYMGESYRAIGVVQGDSRSSDSSSCEASP